MSWVVVGEVDPLLIEQLGAPAQQIHRWPSADPGSEQVPTLSPPAGLADHDRWIELGARARGPIPAAAHRQSTELPVLVQEGAVLVVVSASDQPALLPALRALLTQRRARGRCVVVLHHEHEEASAQVARSVHVVLAHLLRSGQLTHVFVVEDTRAGCPDLAVGLSGRQLPEGEVLFARSGPIELLQSKVLERAVGLTMLSHALGAALRPDRRRGERSVPTTSTAPIDAFDVRSFMALVDAAIRAVSLERGTDLVEQLDAALVPVRECIEAYRSVQRAGIEARNVHVDNLSLARLDDTIEWLSELEGAAQLSLDPILDGLRELVNGEPRGSEQLARLSLESIRDPDGGRDSLSDGALDDLFEGWVQQDDAPVDGGDLAPREIEPESIRWRTLLRFTAATQTTPRMRELGERRLQQAFEAFKPNFRKAINLAAEQVERERKALGLCIAAARLDAALERATRVSLELHQFAADLQGQARKAIQDAASLDAGLARAIASAPTGIDERVADLVARSPDALERLTGQVIELLGRYRLDDWARCRGAALAELERLNRQHGLSGTEILQELTPGRGLVDLLTAPRRAEQLCLTVAGALGAVPWSGHGEISLRQDGGVPRELWWQVDAGLLSEPAWDALRGPATEHLLSDLLLPPPDGERVPWAEIAADLLVGHVLGVLSIVVGPKGVHRVVERGDQPLVVEHAWLPVAALWGLRAPERRARLRDTLHAAIRALPWTPECAGVVSALRVLARDRARLDALMRATGLVEPLDGMLQHIRAYHREACFSLLPFYPLAILEDDVLGTIAIDSTIGKLQISP